MNEHEDLTAEEIAEAASTLAVLPADERLPDHVRQRVEATARGVLGRRAKEHALRRADARVAAPIATSTTSAGSLVLDDVAPTRPGAAPRVARPVSRLAWAGWGIAAAACVLLAASWGREPARAPADAPLAVALASAVEGPGPRGELRTDARGGRFTVRGAPVIDAATESLELWIALEDGSPPRPVALLAPGDGTTVLAAGAVPCVPAPRGGCVAVHDVLVTRERKGGSLVFAEAKVVLRVGPSP